MKGPGWYGTPFSADQAAQLCDEIERRCRVKIRTRPDFGLTAAELLDGLSSQGVIGGDVSRVVELRARDVCREHQRSSFASATSSYRAAEERR